ncbi:MAG: tetratricopeptide repeat protein [Verrucomicrobia bacterium]|nr:tetratricopeptide repeat protein [Verrucomicrobiota bacterium]
MVSTLTAGEEAQLAQTIEMFEVITQSQPNDYQSLEILKEAYSKLNREKDVVGTSKRIAQAYVQMGQLSSAILEFETILQRCPDDPDVHAALQQIESKANNFPLEAMPVDTSFLAKGTGPTGKSPKAVRKTLPAEVEDGRRSMRKLFVETRIISAGDFDLCWPSVDLVLASSGVVEPFIQVLADKGILSVDKSLRLLCDKTRFAFLPLNSYDVDLELARSFPRQTCQRWCVMPFDRMSKSILVATVNPFNQQAAKELADATPNRLLWYLVPPADLVNNIRKAFR